jgi:hypothetical protein
LVLCIDPRVSYLLAMQSLLAFRRPGVSQATTPRSGLVQQDGPANRAKAGYLTSTLDPEEQFLNEEFAMEYPIKSNIPYEEIENGALVLLLLRESKTWEELCGRYAYADPAQLITNISKRWARSWG